MARGTLRVFGRWPAGRGWGERLARALVFAGVASASVCARAEEPARVAPGAAVPTATSSGFVSDDPTVVAAMADTFTLQGVTARQPRRATGTGLEAGDGTAGGGAGYDWDWRGPRDDPEWAWFFNRHGWFPALAAAAAQGDVRATAALLDTLDDWIQQHPPPGGMSFSSAWRPLEAARRLTESWLPIAPWLTTAPGFTAERRARFQASLVAHGEHLRHHHALGGNHLVTELLALTALAVAYPELPGASDWLDYGLAGLDNEYAAQIYPDGTHRELSAHYQRVVALSYQRLLDLLRRDPRTAARAAAWAPRVEALWAYFASIRQPSGASPVNNDSDAEDLSALLAAKAPALAARTAAVSRHFPWAGQTVFRSGDQWAFFEAGPRGTAHDHADHLHLSLSLGPSSYLVDNGRYTYEPGPWRDYFAGPTGHNVLLVDGRGATLGPREQTAPPTPLPWLASPQATTAGDAATLAWGDATFAEPANFAPAHDAPAPAGLADPLVNPSVRSGDWRRLVLHLPPHGWVVVDRWIGFGTRELATLWHWHPAVTVAAVPTTAQPTRQLATHVADAPQPDAAQPTPANPAGRQLSVLVYTTQPGSWQAQRGDTPPAPQGWHSTRFNQKEPALCTLYHQRARGPLLNVWVFQPVEAEPLEITLSSPTQVDIRTPAGVSYRLDHARPAL